MEKELKRLGEKLQLQKPQLAERLLRDHRCGLYFTECLYGSTLLLQYVGDALMSEDQADSSARLAGLFGKEMAAYKIPLQAFVQYIFHLKSAVMAFLEEEASQFDLPPKTFLHAVRVIDQITNSATLAFSKHQKENQIANRLRALYEEEKITLQELRDLKNALKEATIFAITDKNDNIRYANDKFAEITQYTQCELIGQNHHNLLNSGYHKFEFFQQIKQAIKEGRVWKGEICNRAKDGSFYWVDTTIVPCLDGNRKTYQHISIQHDITDKKNAEEALLKSEKLSFVGEMAAGLAHEIKNPLTTIKGFMQIFSHFSEDKKLLYSKTILEEIERINFIVSELMVFSRPHAVYFTDCCVVDLVEGAIRLLRAEAATTDIVLTYHRTVNEAIIFGEKNQLTQVFLNLIKNAMESLPLGGVIDILLKKENSKVSITIQDNGIGMSEDQLRRLGEPFYTTKETGNGLGLMVSYKIIESHNGTVEVESTRNKGTRFMISFPLEH